MVRRRLREWWTQSSSKLLRQSQERLLEKLVRSPVRDKGHVNGVNFVEFRDNSAQRDAACVLAHGFGSGLGFFYNNVDRILESGMFSRVVLFDWLGMGGSQRPPCRRPKLGGLCDSMFTTEQAVDFFIDPLDDLMHALGLESNTSLVGHSLGGYCASRYVLKYPDRVDRLILASPVGFPPKPSDALKSSELPANMRIIDALWSANFTPQQIVRMMGGTRGKANLRRVLAMRIPHLKRQDSDLLAEYLYHITVAYPSGEFAMNSLLQPVVSPGQVGVFAREPLDPLLDKLDPKIHVAVLYGDHDWMRPNESSARSVISRLSNAYVAILPQAGHHLYLDAPDEFVSHIVQNKPN